MALERPLMEAFLSGVTLGSRDTWAAFVDLEERLQEIVKHGSAAWPGVEVAAPEFAAWLGARWPEGALPDATLAALRCDDLYLTCACVGQRAGALAAFERACIAKVPAILGAQGERSWLIDEVQQRLRLKLLVAPAGELSLVAAYRGQATLQRWFRVTVLRTAQHIRSSADQRVADWAVDPSELPSAEALEASAIKRLDHARFTAAIRRAFALLAPEERNLLRFYYQEGLTLAQIGVIVGLDKANVHRRLKKTRAALAARTKRILREEQGLSQAEYESLIRLVGSRIDLSLSSLLGLRGGDER